VNILLKSYLPVPFNFNTDFNHCRHPGVETSQQSPTLASISLELTIRQVVQLYHYELN
jgi:hypothetical protein